MTERCQTKFKEIFENQNIIIYTSFIVGSVAVLYFYRFHFATVTFGYAFGCLICYYGLRSSILHDYVNQLKCYFVENLPKYEKSEDPVAGCETCGSTNCLRHDNSIAAEPWIGLQIHKQLDQAIEEFYNTILEQFITSWYSKVTLQPFFVDELRHQIRYASACLLQRAVKVNYSRFITERLLPCALRHYTVCAGVVHGTPLENKMSVHPAAANRNAELQYLRALTNALLPYLLRANEINNPVSRVLIREIFSGWVLLSLTDVLADPYILNTLIVLATGDETMAQLPATPNYKVEFLETFVRQTESAYVSRGRVLRVGLDHVIADQEHLYAFMQYMKSAGDIHRLQFYKDIKSFQTKILNPELSSSELVTLHGRAADMYSRYFAGGAPGPLRAFADDLAALLNKDPAYVTRLQTSRSLYQAARHSHDELEKIILPKFLHSEEFYKMLIGSRIPTGYHKHMTRKPQEKLLQTALKLGTKLKGALRSQAIDGQILQSLSLSDDDSDSIDNLDILKYLDSIASDATTEQDLTTYKVVITNVETRLQAAPRRGTVRVFSVAVHALGGGGGAGARLCALARTEHDFHLLRSKLHEFHGDRLLHDLPLPSRRDNCPLETLRYKYEDFLQRLLQKSLLRTSELLHLFLTADGDFSLVVQASSLNATSTDIANIYQTVTHRLRKEKGQHLENFLRNLLVSSDIERYQALKQGTTHVEEALEVIEDVEVEQMAERPSNARNIHNSIFENNFNMEPQVQLSQAREMQDVVKGFSQCCMYLLIKVFGVRSVVSRVVGTLLGLGRHLVDEAFNSYLNAKLRELLSERRLAHLIRLGQGVIFGKKSYIRLEPASQARLARARLAALLPAGAALPAPGLPRALHSALDILQHHALNKQLVYNLLDLCVLELFPELSATDSIDTSKPKS